METGLAQLFHSKDPQKFWMQSFQSAMCVINRRPSSVLPHHVSPYFALFGSQPDYSILKVFEYTCYPCIGLRILPSFNRDPYCVSSLDISPPTKANYATIFHKTNSTFLVLLYLMSKPFPLLTLIGNHLHHLAHSSLPMLSLHLGLP